MRTHGFRTLVRGAAVLVTVAAAVTVAAPSAQAAVPALPPFCLPVSTPYVLPDDGAELNWLRGVPGLAKWRMTTHNHFWSVVATRGSQGFDPDVRLLGSTTCPLGQSLTNDSGLSDWVAIDANSGRYDVGPYIADVIKHVGSTSDTVKYVLQFVDGDQILSTTSPTLNQPIGAGYASWIADIRDVYLIPGVTYTFTVTGGVEAFYLLNSSPTDVNTWTRTPATATPVLSWPDPGLDLEYSNTGTAVVHPTAAGWYGALFVRNGWWGSPVTVRIVES
jgi:hypothetical protein